MFADHAVRDVAHRPLFALVQCREYLHETAKALTIVRVGQNGAAVT
jgi:hypothetical protein